MIWTADVSAVNPTPAQPVVLESAAATVNGHGAVSLDRRAPLVTGNDDENAYGAEQ